MLESIAVAIEPGEKVNSAAVHRVHLPNEMRILHLSPGKLYGGVETLLLALARSEHLCAGLKQEFAVCFEGRLSEELAAAGARVHMLGHTRTRNPLSILAARRAMRELIRREQFGAVVCHMAWPQAIFGPVVRSLGVPLVLWNHDPDTGRHWLDRWAKLSPPDLAICNSKFTAGNLRRVYPGLRAEVVYSPAELPQNHYSDADRIAIRGKLATPPDAVVTVQVGRMEAYKGQMQHLEALGGLRDLPGWICWQVGEAQRPSEVRYFEALRAAATRLDIEDRIRFTGYWPDLPQLLTAADIYCQPNTRPEGFGMTLVEALHARLPVVTAALGPAVEIVDDSCGILVPPGDVPALAAALRRLIEDSTLRRKLAGAGPARADALCAPAREIRKLKEVLTAAFQAAQDSRD